MTAMASCSSASNQALPTLTVTAGLHCGVSLELDEPICSIGSGASAGLVLGDAGIADEHLRLRLADRLLFIEAIGGAVTVAEAGRETLVSRGHGYRARFPVDILLGQARIRLAEPASTATARTPVWYGKPQWLLAAVFMLICAGAVAMLQERPAFEAQDPQHIAGAVSVEQQPETSIGDIRTELALLAEELGLDAVEISIRDGQLVASGRYAAGQTSDWVALQRHFDRQYASRFLLHRQATLAEAETQPQVSFQAIWFGDEPYLIDASGKRLIPGAATRDGWLIERIESDQVVLARGEQRFAFTLDDKAAVAVPADTRAAEG